MLKKRIDSFRYAFQGIYTLISTQPNAQIHLGVLFAVLIAGWYFNIALYEWLSIVICFGMVLAAEGFNTAIEFLTDLVSPDYHPLAGKTKDVAAGAVLLTAIAAIVVGLLIFVPKLIQLL